MSKGGKDSAEVVKFMALYTRLKEWCDDKPSELVDWATTDSSVKDLCIDLSFAADFLKMNERRARALFAAPVDPVFVVAWREYEERYESIVRDVWLGELFAEFGPANPDRTPAADLEWKLADNEADQQAGGINHAIVFAFEQADDTYREFISADRADEIQEGIAAWDRLIQDTDFDLRGVFRRRALVPFVLVPRKISDKHGSTETRSLLRNLREAHEAFVYGAPNAALALMRSVTEAVLRDHYRADGSDLSERIRSARNRLPRGANEAALHRLRKLGNAVLHLDREIDEGLTRIDEVQLEKDVVSLLYVLRALIEGAP